MKELAGLRREVARLKAQVGAKGAGAAGRPYDRFWAWVSGIPQDPPLRPEEYPAGLYESLVKSARDGQPGTDVVELRIREALERSLREHQASPGSAD